MRNYRWKKIYLNIKRTKWCITRIYNTRKEMQQAYYDYCKKYGRVDRGCFLVSGVSIHYSKYILKNKKAKFSGETGIVMLYADSCGAGVVSHEFMHAVLWALRHPRIEKYPIVIKSMKQEEQILRGHTLAVRQFYKWFWKVVEHIKKPA